MRLLLFTLGFAAVCGCMDSGDPDLGERRQAETIEVHSCPPGYWQIDDWCIDPTEYVSSSDDMDVPGVSGDDEDPLPVGGGHGSGGPGPKPDRKQCSSTMGVAACLACCEYNNVHVDGWVCNRKRTPEARAKCWREANKELARCQVVVCDRHIPDPIITTAVPR